MNTSEQNGRILQLENHLQELRRVNYRLKEKNEELQEKVNSLGKSYLLLVKDLIDLQPIDTTQK